MIPILIEAENRNLTEGKEIEYIQVTKDNIGKEHICCAISNNKDIQVSSKKDWMMKCFDDGLVFLKSTERGKCFIEYIPSENAWVPILAENYMYIDCFWVSGSFKGHGYSNDLLNSCIEDSKSKGNYAAFLLLKDNHFHKLQIRSTMLDIQRKVTKIDSTLYNSVLSN